MWLILTWATGSTTWMRGRRTLLIEVFKSFFRGRAAVQQMIIITHERELEEAADTLYLVENVNGVSRVKEIIPS